ncbi:MAG: class I SAM-dependent methyltransferase [Bacteroidetes bacterium]|nr:MAG: class I SAM-dependent methyltransferase [Bacteroidota bacterium]
MHDGTGSSAPVQDSAPYRVLAVGYDLVMAHVAYDAWAEYIEDLLDRFRPGARTILELGCGTGSLALELQPRGPFRYLATDREPQMIRVARRKAEHLGRSVLFDVADFTSFRVAEPVDAVLLLYDGLNYLLEPAPIRSMLACVHAALAPGGVFVFDQSTPANSINNADFFEDEGEQDGFRYVRRSAYDPEARLHTTTFEITIDGRTFVERHVQRAYTRAEMQALIDETPFEVVAAFDGFSDDEAHDDTERIHWVLRRREAAPAS